jgi:hypothetical protein
MKSIRDQIDDGEITPNEAAAQLALITAMQKKLKARESILRDYCTENIDPKSHITTSLGEVSYKRGSEGSWKVKDPVAFAQWLIDNGEDASVERVPYPLEFATKPDAIEACVRAHKGEEPAGVQWSNSRADSVAVKLPADWDSMFNDPIVLGQASELLGIEKSPVGGVVAYDGIIDAPVLEEDPWSEVQA